jgi:hypothetical protein
LQLNASVERSAGRWVFAIAYDDYLKLSSRQCLTQQRAYASHQQFWSLVSWNNYCDVKTIHRELLLHRNKKDTSGVFSIVTIINLCNLIRFAGQFPNVHDKLLKPPAYSIVN